MPRLPGRRQPWRGPAALIVGGGAQTPIGRTAPAALAAARAGVCRFREHPFIFDRALEPLIVSRAAWLDDALAPAARLSALLGPAASEALDAALAAGVGGRFQVARPGIFLALPPDRRPGIGLQAQDRAGRTALDAVAAALPWTAPPSIEIRAGEQAAGLVALERACEALQGGAVDLALVGGADSYVGLETLRWLEAEQRLHGPANPWGIIPGEAAGFVALVSAADRRARDVTSIATVRSVAVGDEPAPEGSGVVCIGEGLTAAFQDALEGLPDGEQVDAVVCDMNGEAERGDELGFTLGRVSQKLSAPGEFYAPADRWGDVGAATGTLLLLAAAAGWQRRYARGPNALVWASSGRDPARAAALLRAPEPARMR